MHFDHYCVYLVGEHKPIKAREHGDAKKFQARVYATKYVGGRTDVVDY